MRYGIYARRFAVLAIAIGVVLIVATALLRIFVYNQHHIHSPY
jgi:hypothetical protein